MVFIARFDFISGKVEKQIINKLGNDVRNTIQALPIVREMLENNEIFEHRDKASSQILMQGVEKLSVYGPFNTEKEAKDFLSRGK